MTHRPSHLNARRDPSRELQWIAALAAYDISHAARSTP